MWRGRRNLLYCCRSLFIVSACFLSHGIVVGQQTIFGKLIEHVESLVLEMPGSSGNQYQDPTLAEVGLFNDALAAIMHADYTTAVDLAADVDYRVLRFIDNTLPNNQEFIILEKAPSGTNYWGTVIYNHNACRDVVIQCPHPRLDSNTALEGAYIFSRLNARAMMIAGTHRCNSTTASNCSGTTSVCGSSASYRISDIAHNDASIFQTVTEFLANEDPDLLFIQLHGFAKISGDPNLIISNGTRDTPAPDPISALRQSLLDIDSLITFKIIHIHTDWTRLTGFTNTEGRYLNGSPDACTANAFTSSGRFVHIEQEYEMFREDATGWDLMFQGLDASVECLPVSIRENEMPAFTFTGNGISFDGLEEKELMVEMYFTDGQLWLREELDPKLQYRLPENVISILILRSMTSGAQLYQRKFYNIR